MSNCPILERTADGTSAGRCWFYCPDDVCPRHGSVGAAIERHQADGSLTDEDDHVRWFPTVLTDAKPSWFRRVLSKLTGN